MFKVEGLGKVCAGIVLLEAKGLGCRVERLIFGGN